MDNRKDFDKKLGWSYREHGVRSGPEFVADVRQGLELAVSVLQLDVSGTSQRMMKLVAVDTNNLINRSVAIASSVARISAQNQQILHLQKSDQFKKIKACLSPPDPWTNHMAARQRHEPHTGTWLPQSDQYQRWKAGDIQHLWLCGEAGCGKPVLFYTVAEDIQLHCKNRKSTMHAAFYFTRQPEAVILEPPLFPSRSAWM